MSYKNLSVTEKLNLIEKLNWDYNISAEDILAVIENRLEQVGAFNRDNLFARSLETFLWEDLVNLWGLDNCVRLYTGKIRRMIFDRMLKEEYDAVFAILRGDPLPIAGQSTEDVERLRSALLFNRRIRCKQRIFQSPLLRRP